MAGILWDTPDLPELSLGDLSNTSGNTMVIQMTVSLGVVHNQNVGPSTRLQLEVKNYSEPFFIQLTPLIKMI